MIRDDFHIESANWDSDGDALRAMQGHVLAEAATYGTYSLNAGAEG